MVLYTIPHVRVVVDTNVVVSALRSRRGASNAVLRHIAAGKLTLALSVPVVLEYEDVLLRPGMVPQFHEGEISRYLDALCACAIHQEIFFSWRPVLSDPGDEMLLELAVAAGATHIVTHNKRHFTQAVSFGICVVTPSELLKLL